MRSTARRAHCTARGSPTRSSCSTPSTPSRTADARIIELLELERLRTGTNHSSLAARPLRLTLPAGGGRALARELADVDLELPRINYRAHNGLPYRYAYGASAGDAAFLKRLAKVDVTDGSVTLWDEPDAWAGEPVFVPRPGAEAEDDGVVLSVVLDAAAGTSFLLVLDAATFTEVARARAPHHIPFGFHGQFFSA
jgi:carotenoid cleavage dioxygenase-like enzyme